MADGLPFYVRRWLRGVASRMLVIMNRYNHTGGLTAFLRMFSCAGNGCGAGACGHGGGAGRASMCAVGGVFRGDLR